MSNRQNKNSQRHAVNVCHERVPLDDDFEVVQARTSSLRGPGGTAAETARSPLRGRTTWTVGTSWAPEDDPEFCLDTDSEWHDNKLARDIGDILDDTTATREQKKKSEASARPKVHWKRHFREEYLEEMVIADGRGEFRLAQGCPDCIARGTSPPLTPSIRCQDCFVPDLTCPTCCVRRHSRNPYHQVEKWTGSSFIKTSLKDIGLTIHLNHGSMCCPLPIPVDSRFRVLHTNGIHEVALSYCGCSREIPRHLQLLRRGLYPASQQNTRTCITTALLRLLHILSLTAKVSTYDVYCGLEHLTPYNATRLPKSRYRPLVRALTQWRHLKLLKRAGRGHSASGAEGTANGELAILCPSCPHPGINLDPDWTRAPPEMQFLYALLVCIDANFRLKNNLVSNYSSNPGLGIGMAYLVPLSEYSDYVLSQADEEDISTCIGFQALAKATTRNTRGLQYTGVGAVVCGQSEMILPNAVGNLQKGEHYSNIDYIFASAIRATQLLIVCVSYDIVCQWFINIFQRMFHWPPHLRLRPGLHLRPFIPKFHYWAHKDEGHEQYSFNYGDGAALSDGEAIKRVWGGHNALAGSTKVTGPGTQHDILDNNFGFWNYLKYISMGKSLIKKYKSAVAERNRQAEAHRGLTSTLPGALVEEWEVMCVEWTSDTFPKTKPSPFKSADAELSKDEAVRRLEEAEAEARPAGVMPLHKTLPTSFIRDGLDLEESQRRLRALALETAGVPKNLCSSELKDQRELLRSNIEGWEQIRSVYMPGLVQLLAEQGTSVPAIWDSNPNPEDVQLWLPSSIPGDRRRDICAEAVHDIELKLRVIQCTASLQGLRQVLRLKARMIHFKQKNVTGQREGTRSCSIIDRVHARAIRFVQKYWVARLARLALEGPGSWELIHRELKNEDVRSYSAKAKKKDANRHSIWEDGDEPPTQTTSGVFDSDSDSDLEDLTQDMRADAGRLTAVQELKRCKKGTGETRKDLSWIWTTTPLEWKEGEADHMLRAEWARSRARTQQSREEVHLVLEEMRRVLAFLDHSARAWGERIVARGSDASPSLMEGLQSYANKQILHQKELAATFRELWRTPLAEIDSIPRSADEDNTQTTNNSPDGNDNDEVDSDESDDEGEGHTGEPIVQLSHHTAVPL